MNSGLATFPIHEPAPNGLRRGITTGTCAAAAAQASFLALQTGAVPEAVNVILVDEAHYVSVAIDAATKEHDGVRVFVVKDAGDDPDQTHLARIHAKVSPARQAGISFRAGTGVGTVTQAGLAIPPGEPAINPGPRKMITHNLMDVSEAGELSHSVEIGCENGEAIAKKTFNPRLGIVGGISILGTTGIVEPKSLAAFVASIELYVRVAVADRPEELVFAPGNIGQRFARAQLKLPAHQVVQMSNYVGLALKELESSLAQSGHRLNRLWMVGHPGKLAKILDCVWDTHSSASAGALEPLARFASNHPACADLVPVIAGCTTVEGLIQQTSGTIPEFWRAAADAIGRIVLTQLTRVETCSVVLFDMNGTRLTPEQPN